MDPHYFHSRLVLLIFCCCSTWIFNCQAQPIKPSNNQPSSQVVTELLTTLFRQTIYHRIENLLLDPGRKSTEKQKLIESAVDNYHRQKMILPQISEHHEDDIEEQSQPKSVEKMNIHEQEFQGSKADSFCLFLSFTFAAAGTFAIVFEISQSTSFLTIFH